MHFLSVLGIILIVIAIVVICYRTFSTQKRLDQLVRSGRQKIGEIVQAYSEAKRDLGELGEFNSAAEECTLVGEPKCANPLISPLGERPCVYYRMKITESHIEYYYEKDSEGRRQRRQRTVRNVLQSSENSTRFQLVDDTGAVTVDPRDGEFDGEIKSVEHCEPARGSEMRYGGFSFGFSSYGHYESPATIHYEEYIIGLDQKLTVIGTLCDKMGDLLVEKHNKTKVIVSTKSPETMLAETKKTMQTQLIATIVCAILGVIGLIVGLIIGVPAA